MKFYFTYGTWKGFPYKGGWTVVKADDKEKAISIFRLYHPDHHENCINCTDVYGEDYFHKSKMYKGGNLGAYCHEIIELAHYEYEQI